MANEMVPYFDPGDNVTCYTSAAVVGKRFVSISGAKVNEHPRVAQSGAGVAAVGVACYDAAINTLVPVQTEGVVPVTAGAAITAGDPIKSDASGRAIPQGGTGIILGYAWDDNAGAGDVPVKLNV